MATDHDIVEVRSRAELRAWLAANHDRSGSIWLASYKKHSNWYLPYDAIVEEVLCFGWIDSQPRKLDADRSLLRLSPRKPGSGWSQVNKTRIERLLAEHLMTPAGLACIERAKADGSWQALDEAHAGTVPDDLAAAFAGHPGAAERFAGIPPSTRRAILEWITSARRVETRAARVEETARLAAQGIRANQWPK